MEKISSKDQTSHTTREIPVSYTHLDVYKRQGRAFAEEILEFIRLRMQEYQEETGNLYKMEATHAEGTTHRFAREDQKRYPDIIQAGPVGQR